MHRLSWVRKQNLRARVLENVTYELTYTHYVYMRQLRQTLLENPKMFAGLWCGCIYSCDDEATNWSEGWKKMNHRLFLWSIYRFNYSQAKMSNSCWFQLLICQDAFRFHLWKKMTTTAGGTRLDWHFATPEKMKVQSLCPQLMPVERESGRSFVVHKTFLKLGQYSSSEVDGDLPQNVKWFHTVCLL